MAKKPQRTELTNDANELKELIAKRTGVKPEALACPREKSDMTPCVARDGTLAVALNMHDREICVGCERSVPVLLQEERLKHSSSRRKTDGAASTPGAGETIMSDVTKLGARAGVTFFVLMLIDSQGGSGHRAIAPEEP